MLCIFYSKNKDTILEARISTHHVLSQLWVTGEKKIKMAEEAVPESEDQASPRKIAN